MMLRQQFLLLSPVLSIFLLLLVFILYVYYSTDKRYRLKLLLAPALLVACVLTIPYVGVQLGYGWPAPLPQSFEYMAHKTILVGTEKRWIDVLVSSRKPFLAEPRLHRIAWTENMETALDQAQQMKQGKEGGDIVMSGEGGQSLFGDRYPAYVPKRVLPREQAPKAPIAPRRAPEQAPREAPGTPQTEPRSLMT